MVRSLVPVVCSTILLAGSAFGKPLILESQSRLGFDASVAKLLAQVKKHKWKTPKVYDLQATMNKFGHTVKPVKVVSVCNPKYAAEILSNDAHRYLSAMMPCRISVYQKADRKTYFARVNSEAMAASIGGDAGKTMASAGTGIEKILAPLLRK